VLLVAPLATFCFVGSLSLNARPSPPADRPPNVLLISIDTLRADHVGCYGYARQTTPKIDAMAARGVIFERAISQSNTTLPAHASMLTGLYPIEHGCDPARQTALSPRVDTLAEIMLQHGYHTAAVTSVSWVSAEFGLDQGFERFLYHERSAAPQVKRALRLLADFGDRPFFLFVHLFDPHSPYTPPAQYHDMFLAPGEDRGVDGDIMRFFATRDMRAPDPHAVDILRKLYDGEIRYVDDYLGRIFRWLDEHKKLDDTVVIVTADHGESFGENGAWVHGTALYAQQLHVPLIIAYPRRVQPGTRRAELVEASVNILPTILDLVGIPAPARVGRGSLLVRRAAPTRVFSENMLSLLPQYAVQDDTWKLTTVLANGRLNRASAQLFRTAEWTDAHDLAAQYPDVVSEYLGRLESYFTFGHGHQTPAAAPASLSPATIQQLRSLGYLR
jgi:arylsulfatase